MITVINSDFKVEIEPDDVFMSNAAETGKVVWLKDYGHHDLDESKPISDSDREEIAEIHVGLQSLVERLREIHVRHDT